MVYFRIKGVTTFWKSGEKTLSAARDSRHSMNYYHLEPEPPCRR